MIDLIIYVETEREQKFDQQATRYYTSKIIGLNGDEPSQANILLAVSHSIEL